MAIPEDLPSGVSGISTLVTSLQFSKKLRTSDSPVDQGRPFTCTLKVALPSTAARLGVEKSPSSESLFRLLVGVIAVAGGALSSVSSDEEEDEEDEEDLVFFAGGLSSSSEELESLEESEEAFALLGTASASESDESDELDESDSSANFLLLS